MEGDEYLFNISRIAQKLLEEEDILTAGQTEFIFGDFLKEDWSSYDVIFY